ncbi:MAG: radical SAM protein [Pseudodesulfovibrio sp.]|nr:radical SAM protein [Pseudodesulfovibrio sp.]
MMKININYFVINKRLDNILYFLKRGHFFPLLWDRFKWHWFPRLNIIPNFPQTVDIEAALSCQLQCPMCTRAQMDDGSLRGIMDFDLYCKIIDECAAHNVFSIKLSWRGEPTMNPRLIEMVRYAKAKGIRDVAFLTNGGLLTESMLVDLVDAGLDWISFSIDGLYDDYERIRKPITFDQITKTVRRLAEIKQERRISKPLVRIQTISSVVDDTPEYYDYWAPYVDRIAVIAEQHREDPSRIKHDPNYVCQSPFQRVFITWDGVVIPCHGDYHLHHDMGTVQSSSLKTLWNSEKFRSFRRDMRTGRRLEHTGCTLCPDGGEYVGDMLKVGDRKIPIIKYTDNNPEDTTSTNK